MPFFHILFTQILWCFSSLSPSLHPYPVSFVPIHISFGVGNYLSYIIIYSRTHRALQIVWGYAVRLPLQPGYEKKLLYIRTLYPCTMQNLLYTKLKMLALHALAHIRRKIMTSNNSFSAPRHYRSCKHRNDDISHLTRAAAAAKAIFCANNKYKLKARWKLPKGHYMNEGKKGNYEMCVFFFTLSLARFQREQSKYWKLAIFFHWNDSHVC